MSKEIKLSYVITTYNKLPFLKEGMIRLLKNLKEDEEIVVVDGGSKDGTVEYLTDLYKNKKIDQFISEKDKGEAHGFNKGMMMARGELIKIITDDDAFYFPGIQECKKFMFENAEVDVLAGNIGIMEIDDVKTITFAKDFQNHFEEWNKNNTTVFFCGLSLMFRKKSLALTGLFNPGFIQIDVEFSARITKLSSVNIAWYTNALVVAIRNPQSGFTNLSNKRNIAEQKKISKFYDWEMPKQNNMLYSASESIKSLLRPVKNALLKNNNYEGNKNYFIENEMIENISSDNSKESKAFIIADHWLESYNKKNKSKILFKKRK
jgi:glycosyltransferase involved in cell wall biosynthesis